MDYYRCDSSCVDIYTIYQRYCDIMSAQCLVCRRKGCTEDDATPNDKISRDSLAELLKVADSRHNARNFIFDEVCKLMSRLELVADFSKFSRFYDFVFFICRENGQKNITVSRAITAWRMILAGRFRLLHQWCDFVEKNQRHNIPEDTWKQVLAFSRCVHENLEGYDPEGAWPVLIDEFVEHMYRQNGCHKKLIFSEVQPCVCEDPLPGLKILPGLKRKLLTDFENHNLGGHDCKSPHSTINLSMAQAKRYKQNIDSDKYIGTAEMSSGGSLHACSEYLQQNNSFTPNKSLCAVEGCLSKGLAELLSDRCGSQLRQERRVS